MWSMIVVEDGPFVISKEFLAKVATLVYLEHSLAPMSMPFPDLPSKIMNIAMGGLLVHMGPPPEVDSNLDSDHVIQVE